MHWTLSGHAVDLRWPAVYLSRSKSAGSYPGTKAALSVNALLQMRNTALHKRVSTSLLQAERGKTYFEKETHHVKMLAVLLVVMGHLCATNVRDVVTGRRKIYCV